MLERLAAYVVLTMLVVGCAEQPPPTKGVQFLVFHADWCAPCRLQDPIVEKLEKEFPSVTFRHVDIDQDAALGSKYGVDAIPCMVILVDGRERDRFVGLRTQATLAEQLSKYEREVHPQP